MDTIDEAAQGGRRRRRHSAEFKAQAVQACRHPGVSIASVALAHGLNANLLRRWLIERNAVPPPLIALQPAPRLDVAPPLPVSTGPAQFVPINVQTRAAAVADIRIELRRGPITVSVSWPTHEATACAVWLRECLR